VEMALTFSSMTEGVAMENGGGKSRYKLSSVFRMPSRLNCFIPPFHRK